ncbi:putative glycoside hydrolase [Spirochaetota bacterium]
MKVKKAYLFIIIISALFILDNYRTNSITASVKEKINSRISKTSETKKDDNRQDKKSIQSESYSYPKFYRGIYLNIVSARNFKKLVRFVEESKRSHVNAFVLDTQSSRYKKCIVPQKNVKYLLDNKIHPIARIVVFPNGLKRYPISEKIILDKLKIAESACKAGFKEIQFDYIRFNDSRALRYLSVAKRYKFIEGFLLKARKYLKAYNVKIAADVFGRVPLNRRDIIGQRMEGLDKVVDIICPMAYPSHYTWSRKLQHNPYYTVKWTSSRANKRTKKAEIVTYIQAFKMKIPRTMSFNKYIQEQIKAIHDSGIRGYLMWNARQRYEVPMKAMRDYYSKKKTQI